MKTQNGLFFAAVALAGVAAGIRAADNVAPPAQEDRKQMRILAGPERRVIVQRDGDKGEKETVAFLGVETTPVSGVLGAQLALPRGTGLVVNHVNAKSP